MLRYAISNLSALGTANAPDLPGTRRAQWLHDLRCWALEGIDFVQLREKNLDAGELLSLATEGMGLLQNASPEGMPCKRPKLLMNSRPDIAAAARADGVHLTARTGELTPEQVRAIFQAAGVSECTVSVSCHNLVEVNAARRSGADLLLFGPVFGKSLQGARIAEGTGLASLGQACASGAAPRVLALGGITSGNAAACLDAGAAGIAGIRYFAREVTQWGC